MCLVSTKHFIAGCRCTALFKGSLAIGPGRSNLMGPAKYPLIATPPLPWLIATLDPLRSCKERNGVVICGSFELGREHMCHTNRDVVDFTFFSSQAQYSYFRPGMERKHGCEPNSLLYHTWRVKYNSGCAICISSTYPIARALFACSTRTEASATSFTGTLCFILHTPVTRTVSDSGMRILARVRFVSYIPQCYR